MSMRRCNLVCRSEMFTPVCDAISIADAFDKTTLHQLLQTSQHRSARQFERVRDLTGASGRTHHGAQKYVNANSSKRQTIALYRELGAVVVCYGPKQAQIETKKEQTSPRQSVASRRPAFRDKNVLRSATRPN